MSTVLAALSIGVLLWPRSVVESRLAAIGVATSTMTSATIRWKWAVLSAAIVAAAWTGIWVGVAVATVGWECWRRHSRRSRAVVKQRADESVLSALSVMIAELSVGAHPAIACRRAAEEIGANPLHEDDGDTSTLHVLTSMASRAELGGDVAAGLDQIPGAQSGSWARVGVAWRTAERHGLPMASTLTSVREDLVSRKRFTNRTESSLAGARATAMVLALLPVLGIGLGQAMGAHPLHVLLGGGPGGVVLVIGCALVVAGLEWSEAITAKVMMT